MNLSKIEIALFAAVMVVNFAGMISALVEGRWGIMLADINIMVWCGLYYCKVHEYNNLRDSIKKGMWWSK